MSSKTMFVMAALGCMTGFADVVRTEYAVTSNAQQDGLRRESIFEEEVDKACFAFGIVPCIEWPTFQYAVSGFRFNLLAGDHMDVYGVDIGLLGNFVEREFGGLQIGGLFNVTGETCASLQIAGLVNDSSGTTKGLQLAPVNVAEKGVGCQIGVINYADDFQGLQIGALNVIKSSVCPMFPFVNFAF